MGGPGLLGGGGEATEFEAKVWVAEDGRLETGAVGRAGASAERGIDREGFGAAEDVAEEDVGVRFAFAVACAGAGFEEDTGLFADGEVDVYVCGGGGRICLAWAV